LSWYLEALKKYAVFGGRSRRKEYWYFVLFNIVVGIVLGVIDRLLGTYSSASNMGLLSGIYSLAILIPSLAVTVRRLHDLDYTGWWILIVLVPFIGVIVLLVFAVFEGTPGTN
jgi:uncharacterized membrane protein YhaH (DUF805 family)